MTGGVLFYEFLTGRQALRFFADEQRVFVVTTVPGQECAENVVAERQVPGVQEPDLLAEFTKRYPQVKVARSEAEILEDKAIHLVLSSIIPDQRAPLGIRVMQHGKDYMSDKPGITTLDQLAEVRKVQAATKRIYSILYSERHENQATVKAGELAKAGAIGKVVQTIGLGPHRLNPASRPPWFWEPPQYGGIGTSAPGYFACNSFHWASRTSRFSSTAL